MDFKTAMIYAGTKIGANISAPSQVDTIILQSFSLSQSDELLRYVIKEGCNVKEENYLHYNFLARMDCFLLACASFIWISKQSPDARSESPALISFDLSKKARIICNDICGDFDADEVFNVADNRIVLYDVILSESGPTERVAKILKHLLAMDYCHKSASGLDDVIFDDKWSPAIPLGSKRDRDIQEQCYAFCTYIWENAMNFYNL